MVGALPLFACASRRLLVGFLLAAGALTLHAASAQADDLAMIRQRGTLIVGVKTDYPPFGFRSPAGEIEGIEPDLAADVANSLGVKLELVPVVASNRIQLLEQGRIDLIIATMNATRERKAEIDIVRPAYYASGYNVMVPRAMKLTSWADLKGKKVCGIEDAYFNYQATMNFEFQVVAFASTEDALTALQQGHCAGLLYDDAAIEGSMQQLEWRDYTMPLASQEVQPWSLAVRKDQPQLADYLSGVVRRWVKDGTILNLETKYHIRHSSFAEEAHQKASGPAGN